MGFLKASIILVLIIFIFSLFMISKETDDARIIIVCALIGSILIINGLMIISY